jgi:hypothetical protein
MSGARADDAEHVGVVLLVVGDDEGLDLDVGLVALGPQRADGPVGHPHRERLLHRGSALALEEAARDLARGVGLLAVVDRQGEEVDPLARGGHRRPREHHRLAVRDQDAAGRQPRHPTGLDPEALAPDVDRHLVLRQVAS